MKKRNIVFACLFFLVTLSIQASVFTVTNTNTSGAGSLYAAINSANTAPGAPHNIVFDIPVSDPNYNSVQGVWVIHLNTNSKLPYIVGSNISIDASTQAVNVGNFNPSGPEIVLDGGNRDSTDYAFFVFGGSAISIRGFNIRHFNIGIKIAGSAAQNCVVAGNYVGTNYNASDTAGCDIGIQFMNSAGNATIGGVNPEDRNIISGNEHIGLRLLNSSHNTIVNNYIGTDRSGNIALRNYDGLSIEGTSQYNLIGGNTPVHRNLISGNVAYGLVLMGYETQYNICRGNYIGTNAAGTGAIPNTYGVLFDISSHYNTVGGLGSGEGNLISGNSGYGLFLYNNGTTENYCLGNLVGTDCSGTVAVPNGNGVVIDGIATRHVLDKNIISGNLQNGIDIHISGTNGHKITRNFIGTDITGTQPLGNGADGIKIAEGAKYNIIGAPDSGNIIAYNGGNGITVLTAADYGNRISCNRIFGNALLGIDLYPQGVSDNDAGDADSGPNQLMNFPVLDSARFNPGSEKTFISGHLDHPSAAYGRVEIFGSSGDVCGHGQAEEYLGFVQPQINGSFVFEINAPLVWNYVTATATDSSGNTSEFSLNLELPGPNVVETFKENESFTVFPNPATDYILVNGAGVEEFSVEIANLSGQVLILENHCKVMTRINIAALESGWYCLRIGDGQKTEIKSLIVR